MEICITKKVFMTVDVDVDENTTPDELSDMIKGIVEDADITDYEEEDYNGKEQYEAYDTYTGCDIQLNF